MSLFVLDHLSAETNEIYFHPAVCADGPHSGSNRQAPQGEFEVLTSTAFRERVQHPDLKLTNYFGLTTDT